jgi:hypothetical protein
VDSRPGSRTIRGFPGGPPPFVFLFLIAVVFTAPPVPGAEPGDRINREILQAYLEARGIPYAAAGDSIFAAAGFPGIRADGTLPAGEAGILVLAAPLAYPGEPSLEEGPGEEGADLPLRFAIPLSLIQEAAENPEAAEAAPVLAAFLGGGESGGEAELEKILDGLEAAENRAPGDPAPILGDRMRRSIFFLDIPMGKRGTPVFRFKETPPLGQMRSILRICAALKLPWSFENPAVPAAGPRFSADPGTAAENSGGLIRISLRRGREGAGYSAGGEDPIPDAAGWGEFFRRYALNQPEEEDRERNYLAFRLPGLFFVISELPLVLGFLALALLFFCGLLFFPAPNPGPSRRMGGIAAAAVLWAAMIAVTAAAFHRLSLYPLYAPALIPAFAARNLRRPLPRYICMGAAVLYLGTALFFFL